MKSREFLDQLSEYSLVKECAKIREIVPVSAV
jgi:hypothetical protein